MHLSLLRSKVRFQQLHLSRSSFTSMVDIKNMFMMLATFKTKFVIVVIVTVTLVVYASSLLIYAMGW